MGLFPKERVEEMSQLCVRVARAVRNLSIPEAMNKIEKEPADLKRDFIFLAGASDPVLQDITKCFLYEYGLIKFDSEEIIVDDIKKAFNSLPKEVVNVLTVFATVVIRKGVEQSIGSGLNAQVGSLITLR